MKICECKDWQTNMPKIDGIFDLAFWHGLKYDGEYFVYCPWCGNKLIEEKKGSVTDVIHPTTITN